ncbi:MAG: protein translocase subunit SecF [Nocardioidaceae bacterium]
MSKLGQIGARLYSGDVSIDFVGRRRTWYAVSLLIVLLAVGGLVFRGLNYGIEFRGGVEFTATVGSSPSQYVEDINNAVVDTAIDAASHPVVTSSGDTQVRVQTEPLSTSESIVVADAIKSVGNFELSSTTIGPTWGQAVAKKALTGLGVFLVLVVLFIWAYFREWRMSAAAIVALAHDLVITVGVYALTGFEVTPATVTGFLTILGYSLYDTVVVFDKVRENTRGITTSTRRTYAQSANLAVNQTLVRSINTSVAALLPVGAILYVGVVQLGSGPLKDLALALFVGMAAGAYSSIFIAAPLLAQLKMREPSMQAQAKRVASRRSAAARGEAASEAVAVGSGATVAAEAGGDAVPAPVGTVSSSAVPPGRAPSDTSPPGAPPEGKVRPVASGATVATSSAARRPTPPAAARPMSSAAAKRAQPRRQVRSKRKGQ